MGGRACRAIGVCVGVLWAGRAAAQLTQPDGVLVPDQTVSGDYWSSLYSVSSLGLGTLLETLEDGQLDYRLDAATEPSRFTPLCELQGTLLVRGSACHMDFGWYCVDHVPTSNTDPGFVPLVTAQAVRAYHDALVAPNDVYQSDDGGFVPLIGLPPLAGAPLAGVRDHAVFQNCPSRQIGFVLMPTGINIGSVGRPVCTQPKYVERALNTVHAASGDPWISALVYPSVTHRGAVYLAFEDLVSSPTAFVAPAATPAGWTRDSDFNDFVYRVDGVGCEGGGQLCDTGLFGVCSIGVSECALGSAPGACTPRFSSTAEVCDQLDNDCNGAVDDGADLCSGGSPVCFMGTCVPPCSAGQFVCPAGFACDGGSERCVANGCLGVECGPDQVCTNGNCGSGCDGVVCPAGQDCLAGACVDLCADQTCPAGHVCHKGACVADCHCAPCPAGFTCLGDGRCADSRCDGVVCPTGTSCVEGNCVLMGTGGVGGVGGTGGVAGTGGSTAGTGADAAAGGPSGGVPATGAGGPGGSTGGGAAGSGDSSTGGSTTSGGSTSGGSTSGGTAPGMGGGGAATDDSGCGCRAPHRTPPAAGWLALLALAFAVRWRRARGACST